MDHFVRNYLLIIGLALLALFCPACSGLVEEIGAPTGHATSTVSTKASLLLDQEAVVTKELSLKSSEKTTPIAVATITPDSGPGRTNTSEPRQAKTDLSKSPSDFSRSLVIAVIDGNNFIVELAVNDDQRRKGLSGRQSLSRDAGMLFVFPTERTLSFWMKNVSFPLDIIFMDSERLITGIQTMAPQYGVGEDLLKIYKSDSPSMYALEINGGISAQLGIEVGMRVSLIER